MLFVALPFIEFALSEAQSAELGQILVMEETCKSAVNKPAQNISLYTTYSNDSVIL